MVRAAVLSLFLFSNSPTVKLPMPLSTLVAKDINDELMNTTDPHVLRDVVACFHRLITPRTRGRPIHDQFLAPASASFLPRGVCFYWFQLLDHRWCIHNRTACRAYAPQRRRQPEISSTRRIEDGFQSTFVIFPLSQKHLVWLRAARFRDHVQVSWCRVLDTALKATDSFALDFLFEMTADQNGDLGQLRGLIVPSIPRVLKIALVDGDEVQRSSIEQWITSSLTSTRLEGAPVPLRASHSQLLTVCSTEAQL